MSAYAKDLLRELARKLEPEDPRPQDLVSTRAAAPMRPHDAGIKTNTKRGRPAMPHAQPKEKEPSQAT